MQKTKPATRAITTRRKKIVSKLNNKPKNTDLEEKSNLPITKPFLWHFSLPVFVFLFFLRAIKFSILGIVGCFMEQTVGFAGRI